MLKGDLTSTPLAPLLLELAESGVTGCLVIHDPRDDEALVYLKAGLIYAVSVPGTRPQLGAKLVSSGALAPDALAEALDAQRTELQGWRLGELLVHLGYVEQPLVEAFVKEQVNEALWDLLRWNEGQWKFRKNIKAREDVGPPMTVVELLETLRDRGYEWEAISAIVHGPDAVPSLSTRGDGSQETTLDNDAWSMLCKIDGERSVADLARDCGYTLFEAGLIMVSLVEAGLVDIDEDIDLAGGELYGATTLSSAFAGDLFDVQRPDADDDLGDDDEDGLSRVARMVSEVAREQNAGDAADEDETDQQPGARGKLSVVPDLGDYDGSMVVGLRRRSNESFAASIARVSSALSEVLGDAPSDETPGAGKPVARRDTTSTSDPEWQRRKRLRAAAAAELATAQALIETLRPGGGPPDPVPFSGEVPKVVSRATEERRAAERAVRAARELTAQEIANREADVAAVEAQRQAARAEADRLAAQAAAAAAEAERLSDEVDTQRLAAEAALREAAEAEELRLAEEARLDAEAEERRLAAEEAERAQQAAEAAAAEAQRLAEEAEAQRLAAEEAERLAAEAAEAQRLADEAEAQRIADEAAAAAEAQRLADEAEAQRIAAEAAEAQRIADEAAAAEAQRIADEAAAAEAQRIADEAAAAAEAQRLADEAEAQRIAAEAAEAQRLADDAEAQRLAEQAEAQRLAAEEAERQAAEAQRLADEAEAQRIAADEAAAAAEAQRLADETEAQRLAEEAEAQRVAAEEAERQAAEAAEAAEAQRIADEADAQRLAAEAAEAAEAQAQRQAAEANALASAAAAEREAELESERIAAEEAERTAKAERAARRKAEKLEAELAAERDDDAHAAATALSQLAATESAEAPTEAPAEYDGEHDGAADAAEVEDEGPVWSEAAQADTAALLRELSSLGSDSDVPAAPTQTRAPRTQAEKGDKKAKKKIGLFGL